MKKIVMAILFASSVAIGYGQAVDVTATSLSVPGAYHDSKEGKLTWKYRGGLPLVSARIQAVSITYPNTPPYTILETTAATGTGSWIPTVLFSRLEDYYLRVTFVDSAGNKYYDDSKPFKIMLQSTAPSKDVNLIFPRSKSILPPNDFDEIVNGVIPIDCSTTGLSASAEMIFELYAMDGSMVCSSGRQLAVNQQFNFWYVDFNNGTPLIPMYQYYTLRMSYVNPYGASGVYDEALVYLH